jgi:hypothetical protein
MMFKALIAAVMAASLAVAAPIAGVADNQSPASPLVKRTE